MRAAAKFWMALAVTVAVLAQDLYADGVLSLADWCQIGATGITAISVWLVPDTGFLRYAKAATAVAGAGMLAAQTLATDGVITGHEWWTILIAALGAVGVASVKNKPSRKTAVG